MTDPIITQEGINAIVQPGGDIVAANVSELRSALRGLVNGTARDVVLDLTRTEMVDSSGLGLLIGTYNSLRKVGGRLTIIHASRDLLQLFQSMRMNQHFRISGD